MNQTWKRTAAMVLPGVVMFVVLPLAGITTVAARAGDGGDVADAPAAPSWADATGSDEYGHWADLRIEGTIEKNDNDGDSQETVTVTQRMRWIPPGRYMRGSPEEEGGRRPDEMQHEVVLTRGLWMADTPCTQGFYEALGLNNPSRHGSEDHPVHRVSWNRGVSGFIRELRKIDGLGRARLPTEAEWEYAARAGTEGARYGDLDDIAWHQGNSVVGYGRDKGYAQPRSRPVAQKKANPWGLYDMIGNVWERCADRYAPYPESDEPLVDPAHEPLFGPKHRRDGVQVIRGGGYNSPAGHCRAATRHRSNDHTRQDIGFRFVIPCGDSEH